MASPTDPPPPGMPLERKLLYLGVGIGPALLGLILILFLKSGGTEEPDPYAVAVPKPSRTPARTARTSGTTRAPSPVDREAAARRLFEAAEAFERSNPGNETARRERYRRVYQEHPGTTWARKAEGKVHDTDRRQNEIREKEYEVVTKNARDLAKRGRFVAAVDVLKEYAGENPDDPLRRRAAIQAAAFENESRAAFNAAAEAAEALTEEGKYSDAAALFEALKPGALPEVVARADVALAELREAMRKQAEFEVGQAVGVAHDAFREKEAPEILNLLKARRYADALSRFDAGAAKPDYAGIQDSVDAERRAISTAAAFWRAFLQSVRAHVNKPVSLSLTEGKKVVGTLARVEPGRLFVRTGALFETVPLENLDPDVLVSWTIGPVLSPEQADTDVKAGLFFFCDGHDDLARLYLATAVEKGASIDAVEPVFRAGYLRAARHAAAKKKEKTEEEEP